VVCRCFQQRPRRFLPWAYSSPSRHIALTPAPLWSPTTEIPPPVPSEPTHSGLRQRADTSPGFGVCPVRGHCEVDVHLASLLGVFDVKEQ
jgi:hypothetical protein